MSGIAPSEDRGRISETELQRLLYEYDFLQRFAGLIKTRIDTLNALRSNFINAKNVLDSLKDKKEGHEVLVPIGGGVYIYCSLKNSQNILISLGAGYVIEKTLDQALEYVDERINEIEKSIEELSKQLNQVASKLSEIEPILRKYLSEQRGSR